MEADAGIHMDFARLGSLTIQSRLAPEPVGTLVQLQLLKTWVWTVKRSFSETMSKCTTGSQWWFVIRYYTRSGRSVINYYTSLCQFEIEPVELAKSDLDDDNFDQISDVINIDLEIEICTEYNSP